MQNIIQYIKHTLAEYYPEPEIKAMIRILLCDVFRLSLLDIYTGKDIKLSEKQLEDLDCILERLKKQEPLQYITGHAEFYGLDFEVNENVLIPRPETTELVELLLKDNAHADAKPLSILDIGTGSGCIAIALSLNLPGMKEITAWDVSSEALTVASGNAERLGAKVRFEQKDILEFIPDGEHFDIIVSNPPYITTDEKKDMDANVLDWEPGLALFVPNENPLLFYEMIARLGLRMLNPGGTVYFEINRMFGIEVKTMMEELGYRNVEVMKDLSGNDRMIKALL